MLTLFTSDDLNSLKEKAQRSGSHAVNETGLLGKIIDLEGIRIVLDKPTLLKALVKYGNAITML
jgi:hypothetical protein